MQQQLSDPLLDTAGTSIQDDGNASNQSSAISKHDTHVYKIGPLRPDNTTLLFKHRNLLNLNQHINTDINFSKKIITWAPDAQRQSMLCINLSTKLPMLLFEGYELFCNYAHDPERHLKQRNLIVISILSCIYLLIFSKQIQENYAVSQQIKNDVQRINQTIYNLRHTTEATQQCFVQLIIKDIIRPEIMLQQQAEIIIQQPLAQHLQNLVTPNENTLCIIQSEHLLTVIEALELWLGIIWLAYCFLDDFHEDKIPNHYLAMILGCGLLYTLLQAVKHHKQPIKIIQQRINTFAICVENSSSRLQPETEIQKNIRSQPQRRYSI